MKKLFTFLLLSILTIGMSWAETKTYTWTAPSVTSLTDGPTIKTGNEITLGDFKWTVTATANPTSSTIYSKYETAGEWHIGSSNAAASSLSLTASGFSGYVIKSVSVQAKTSTKTTTKLSISVGESSKTATIATDYDYYTLDNLSASNQNITISITNSAKRAFYIKSIVVVYSTGDDDIVVASPVFGNKDKVVTKNTAVTLSAEDGASIYYTTDGTSATTSSPEYSSAITIAQDATITAIAVKSGVTSAPSSFTYEVIKEPTFGTAAGLVLTGTELTLSSKTTGAKIYYTTDGTNPDANSTEYTSAIAINSAMTVSAVAIYTNESGNTATSDVVSAEYIVSDDIENGTEYTLVKSGDKIEDGQYVIADVNGEYLSSTIDKTTPRITTIYKGASTFSASENNLKVASSATVLELTIKKNGEYFELWLDGETYPLMLDSTSNDVKVISTEENYTKGLGNNVITIDSVSGLANVARIGYVNGGSRYLVMNTSGSTTNKYFRNYNTATSNNYINVRLYRKEATEYKGTLAEMGALVDEGDTIVATITDLTGVEYIHGTMGDETQEFLVAKDAEGAAVQTVPEGDIDYVSTVMKKTRVAASNWALLFAGEGVTLSNALKGKLNDVKGILTRFNDHLMFTLSEQPETETATISLNTYVPCNFVSPQEQTATNNNTYFFYAPEQDEIAYIERATCEGYDGETYTATMSANKADGDANPYGFIGGFTSYTFLLSADEQAYFSSIPSEGLAVNGRAWIVKKNNSDSGESGDRKVIQKSTSTEYSDDYLVYWLSIDKIVTGVTDVNAAKEVAKVVYYNVAGVESAEPFQGVNIVKTVYTDGTSSVAKTVK